MRAARLMASSEWRQAKMQAPHVSILRRGSRPRRPFIRHLAIAALLTLCFLTAAAERPPEFAWALHFDPQTFDPALVEDESAETIRYLTGGVLLRVNRKTFAVEPELAASWRISSDGRVFIFHLRPGLRFSDGSALTSADVVWTLSHTLNPATASPNASLFPSPAKAQVVARGPLTVELRLAARLNSPEWVFDQISIESAGLGAGERVTAGPYYVSQYVRGQFVKLARNNYYWKPAHVAAIRLDILANRQQEMLRLMRGDYQLMASVPPADAAALAARAPGLVRDLGPSLDTEQLWFNQSPRSPMPAWKRAWFSRREFRVAISEAINRQDLARIAYNGHATPADGFISPVNTMWRNQHLKAPHYDPADAMRLFAQIGMQKKDGVLEDAAGHAVEFSILTNADNGPRAQMMALIQQDLAALGIRVTLVTLDFPALIARLMQSYDYDACLLGTTNSSPDPSSTSDMWISSSPTHQWNPREPTPATPWEAEIDTLMTVLATSPRFTARRQALDRVQQIVADQQPFIYLVYRNAVVGLSPHITGAHPSVVAPGLWWNIEEMGWR